MRKTLLALIAEDNHRKKEDSRKTKEDNNGLNAEKTHQL